MTDEILANYFEMNKCKQIDSLLHTYTKSKNKGLGKVLASYVGEARPIMTLDHTILVSRTIQPKRFLWISMCQQ